MTPAIHHLTDSLIGVVGLPNNTFGIERSNGFRGRFDFKYGTFESNNKIGHFDLPQGNYTIIGWSDELTEGQYAGMVEKDASNCYKRYDDFGSHRHYLYVYKSATDSFKSLLRSHGIEGRVLLLNKID